MKPPLRTFSDLKAGRKAKAPVSDEAYAPPTPKVSRQAKGKVLTAAEKAAFMASRPDLKPKV